MPPLENPTGGWETVGTVTKTITLNAGTNTIKLSGNPGPDVDNIRINNSTARLAAEGARTVEKMQLHVYPNPASSQITLESEEELAGVKLINSLGRTSLSESGLKTRQLVLQTGSLYEGIYMIQVRTRQGETLSKKVFIRQ